MLQNPGNENDPVWLSGSTAACGSCHGNSGNNWSSITHGDHTSNSAGYFGQAGKIDNCDVSTLRGIIRAKGGTGIIEK